MTMMYHMPAYLGWNKANIIGFYDPEHYWPRHLKVTVNGIAYHIIMQETIGL